MPKRRMTAARVRQILLWQLAGVNKKSRQKRPHGKSLTLYHHTTPNGAKLITSPPSKIRRGGFMRNTRVWLTNNSSKSSNVSYRGSSVLKIRVPYKSVYKEMDYSNGETHYTVHSKDISGIEVFNNG